MAPPVRPTAAMPTWRIVAAASIGNALEWFDLLVYGYLAVTLSHLFFPSNDENASLLLALGTFGVSYLVRPLGALVLGAYADRAGRKSSLLTSIRLMMIGTFLMAVLPTYRSIGLLAPGGILIARLIQGFSIGGEFGSGTSFLIEHGPERKGFFGSFQWAGQGLAAVLASAFGIGLAALTQDQLEVWGWRLPYFFGLLIGPIGFYIRRRIEETPEYVAAPPSPKPLRELLTRQLDRVFLAIGIAVISNSSNYLILYMPTFAITQLKLPASIGFTATLLGGLILTVVGSPVFGYWSDKVGRSPIMIAAALLFLITAYPAFLLLTAMPTMAVLVFVVCWLSLLKTAYSGVLPSLMAELFPTRTRAAGVALSYNISVPIFGGFAPFFAALLIRLTGDRNAPSFYLMLTALISLGILVAARARLRASAG